MDDCAEIARHRGRRGRRAAPALSRPRGRSLRRARAAQRPRRVFAPCRHRSLRQPGRRRPRDRSRHHRRASRGGGPAHRRRRQLVRYFQPHLERKGRAARSDLDARRSFADYPACEAALARVSARRSACRRSLRTLCLRRRTRQRLRRIDRFGRAAPPVRGGNGRETARLWRDLSARRGFSRRPQFTCPPPAAPRWGSTAS